MPTSCSRTKKFKVRSVHSVKRIPHLQEMDKFEEQEMAKSRPVLKIKLNEWYNWLVDYVPKSIKSAVSKAFSKVKNCILSILYT